MGCGKAKCFLYAALHPSQAPGLSLPTLPLLLGTKKSANPGLAADNRHIRTLLEPLMVPKLYHKCLPLPPP